jgi:hypothetical protein
MPSLAFHCGTGNRPQLIEKEETFAAMSAIHKNSISDFSCEHKFFIGSSQRRC